MTGRERLQIFYQVAELPTANPEGDPHAYLMKKAHFMADSKDPISGQEHGQDENGYFFWTKHSPHGYYNSYRIGGDYTGMVRGNFPRLLDRPATAQKKAELEAAGANYIQLKYESVVSRPNENYDPELAQDVFANNSCRVKDMPEDIEAFALITPDGEWHALGEAIYFGESINDDDNWDWNFTVLLANNSDKLAVGMEFHL
jgi:hypothetical protein